MMQKRNDIQIYELAYNNVNYGLWDGYLLDKKYSFILKNIQK
jgi:hypothetical protein